MEQLNIVFGWGSAIGVGVFIVCVAATFYLSSKAIETLSKVDREQNAKK